MLRPLKNLSGKGKFFAGVAILSVCGGGIALAQNVEGLDIQQIIGRGEVADADAEALIREVSRRGDEMRAEAKDAADAGNRNLAMLKPHEHHADRLALVQSYYQAPSLYDEALCLLARRGVPVPADRLSRDWTQPYQASPEVETAWLSVYRAPEQHWDLYQLAEKLTDLEDAFRLWRFRHVTTVERIIGFKRGTGGTGGVSYLRKMLDVVLFPELWQLRTDL